MSETPLRQRVAERRAALLRYRRQGMQYVQLVEEHPELGYSSASAARKDCQRALAVVVAEPAKDLLTLELTRIDELWQAIHAKGMAGDLWAIDRLMRMSERRAKLAGLDSDSMRVLLTREAESEQAKGILGNFFTAAVGVYEQMTDPDD